MGKDGSKEVGVVDRRAAARSSFAVMDRAVVRPPVNRLLWLALAAAGVGALGLAGWGYSVWVLTPSITVAADHLSVSRVRYGDFQGYVAVSGVAEPATIVDLDATSAGEIRELRVRDGERVAAGQVLVVLRNPELSLQVTAEEAQLAQGLAQLAAVQLDQAQSRLQHQRDLLDAAAQLALDNAKFQREAPLVHSGVLARAPQSDLAISVAHDQAVVATLQQEVAADRAGRAAQDREMSQAIATTQDSITRAEDNLGNLTITAPIAGLITGFEAQRGQVIAAGQSLGEVDDMDRLRIAVDVDQFYLGQVNQGGAATLDLDGQTYQLRVSSVEPEVTDRTFRVKLEFVGNIPPGLHAGQSVQPRLLIGDAHQSLEVANGAYLAGSADGDGPDGGVFVVSAGGTTATRRNVEFGRNNPDWVEVLGGLSAGERIIVSDTEDFKGIDRINIRGAIAPETDQENTP